MAVQLARRRVIADSRKGFAKTILALPNLFSYWRMNDADQTLRDSVGTDDGNYVSAPAGGPALISGDPAAASKHFVAANGEWANPSAAIDVRASVIAGFSFGCMVNLDSGGPSGDVTYLFAESNGSGSGNSFGFGLDAAARHMDASGWNLSVHGTTVIPLGADVLLVYSLNTSTGAVHMWLDGVPEATGVIDPMTVVPGLGAIALAGYTSGAFGPKYLDGYMAEAFTVLRELTDAEVANIQKAR